MINKIKDLLNKEDINYSIYIKNLKNGETIKYNENKIVSSASTIKLFIMGKVFEMIQEGKTRDDYRLEVSREEMVPGGIVSMLSEDNSYTILDLITLMIVESDNTATNILIDYAGIDNINKFIEKHGFTNTLLQRKMMDFKARQKGRDNFTTAKDLGRFLEDIYMCNILETKYCQEMIYIMQNQLDARMMRRELKDEVVIAHKTGNLMGLNHDAGIIFGSRGEYVFIMFTWDAKDNLLGRKLIGKVSKLVYEYF